MSHKNQRHGHLWKFIDMSNILTYDWEPFVLTGKQKQKYKIMYSFKRNIESVKLQNRIE